jgi:single-strand DNA-binding protein
MINEVTLLGRVGQKEFKPTKNGSFICKLSIATDRKYLGTNGETNKITTWHNVNLFNKTAEICNKFVHVGDLVYIKGEISNRKIDENGVSRVIHSITGNDVRFIPTGRKKDEPTSSEISPHAEYHATEPLSQTEYDDSIPF